MEKISLINSKVSKIYSWIDSQLQQDASRQCDACGRCCDFDAYDHRLYVTTPELIYFIIALDTQSLKSMTDGRCPYNVENKCGVYQHRFAGCRIFCCKGNAQLQSDLSEQAIKKFKQLCIETGIEYQYIDLKKALKGTFDWKNLVISIGR